MKKVMFFVLTTLIITAQSCRKNPVVSPNVDITQAWVMSYAASDTDIPISDGLGNIIGKANFRGQWQQNNYLFTYVQTHYPCRVTVTWDPHWTDGPWTGEITGIY